nr:hypothetical protein [Tanacetum cinerariifolium]
MASSSNRRGMVNMTRPWTTTEETMLCTDWCNAIKTCGSGDITKKGFWSDVFDDFEKYMRGTIREYDAIVSKWKNSIRPKVVAFTMVSNGWTRTGLLTSLEGLGDETQVESLKGALKHEMETSLKPIYSMLLYDLHEENKALKRMNKMSGIMKDSSKQMSINPNNQMVKDLKDDLTFVKSKVKVYDRLLLVVFVCVVFLSLVTWYGYAIDEDATVEDTADTDTTDEDTTDLDIDESFFPKSKGKNVQRSKKPTLTVIFKSPILIKGCVLRLANVQT